MATPTYNATTKSWSLPASWDPAVNLADQTGLPNTLPTGVGQGATIGGAPASPYVPLYAGIVLDVSASTIGSDPAVNSTINCFVSSYVGDLQITDASANYHVLLSQNQNQSQEALAYDNIFDVTLSSGESVQFLNAFTVSGLDLNLPQGIRDQLAGTPASCTFDAAANSVADSVLQKVIREATDGSGNTAAQFLGITLNQLLTNYSVSAFRTAFLSTINSVALLKEDDIVVEVDQGSGNVVVNVTGSSQQAATVCYKAEATNKLINQIDIPHLNAYADTSNNTIKTTAFPAFPGDTFVFGLKSESPEVKFHYNKATSDATNDGTANNSESLNLSWQTAQGNTGYHVLDNNWTLAFRMKMGGTGDTYPVSTAGAGTYSALLPTAAWAAANGV